MSTEQDTTDSAGPEMAHGALCYWQVPAPDLAAAARFYRAVFGWTTDPAQAGFEAPGLIGQFVADRPVSPAAGPLAWISVGDMDRALSAATEHGGSVLEIPVPDGPTRVLATVGDPAGNAVGLVSHAGGRR